MPLPHNINGVVKATDNLTEDTCYDVAKIAGMCSLQPEVDLLAEMASVGTGEANQLAEISAIFMCVRDKVEWHRDPATGEKIYHPELLAKKVIAHLNGSGYLPKGDCDDKATLLMSLLLNRGFICRAVAAWQSLIPPFPGCPDPQNEKWKRINHVYVEVKNPGDQNIVDGGTVKTGTTGKEWLPLEPSSTTLLAFQQNSAVKPMLYFYSVVDGKTIK